MFAIAWNPAALWGLFRMRFRAALALDRAVIRFAERGVGELESEPPYHRLRTGHYDALMAIDPKAQRVTVLRIFQAR